MGGEGGREEKVVGVVEAEEVEGGGELSARIWEETEELSCSREEKWNLGRCEYGRAKISDKITVDRKGKRTEIGKEIVEGRTLLQLHTRLLRPAVGSR